MKNADFLTLVNCYLYNVSKRDCIAFVASHFNLCFVLTDTALHLKTIDTNKFVYTLHLDI